MNDYRTGEERAMDSAWGRLEGPETREARRRRDQYGMQVTNRSIKLIAELSVKPKKRRKR